MAASESESNSSESTKVGVTEVDPTTDDAAKLNCHIYIVCNPTHQFRRENMLRRVTAMGLEDQTHFIEGGNFNGELVTHYMREDHGRGAAACLIGHLRALQNIVKTDASHACVLEDDVLFRNDFIERVNEYLKHYGDRTIIQLFCISDPYDGPCRNQYYGTQGYIVRKDYAQKALQQYDRPVLYWPEDRYPTSEAITMYSNGICLSRDPIIIEDGLSYTLHGGCDIPDDKLAYRMYSYWFGLHRYIDCDPEFKISAKTLVDLWPQLIYNDAKKMVNLVPRCEPPKTDQEKFIFYMFHMLCDWYIDKVEAQRWVDLFFRLISTGKMTELISEHGHMATEVARFYEPSYSERVNVDIDPESIDWSHSLNWTKIPNAPYIYEDASDSVEALLLYNSD